MDNRSRSIDKKRLKALTRKLDQARELLSKMPPGIVNAATIGLRRTAVSLQREIKSLTSASVSGYSSSPIDEWER